MNTITELSKMDGRVYVYLRNETVMLMKEGIEN